MEYSNEKQLENYYPDWSPTEGKKEGYSVTFALRELSRTEGYSILFPPKVVCIEKQDNGKFICT